MEIVRRRRYRRAMMRNFLPYVEKEFGEEIAERLRVAEGRVARPASAPTAEGRVAATDERPSSAPAASGK